MAIILHFRLKNETTPAGVVIVKGIPFAYSGGGGFYQEKKKFF